MTTIEEFNAMKKKTVALYEEYQDAVRADGDWMSLWDIWSDGEEEMKNAYIELHVSTFGFRPLSYGLSSQTLTESIFEGYHDAE